MIDNRHRFFFFLRKRSLLLNLSLTILLLSCLAFTPFSVLAAQDEPVNFAKGKNYEVKVEIVQPRRTAQGKLLYRLRYRYEFKGQPNITIKGLGTFPAKGQQEHLYEGEYLEFFDEANHLLTKVKLKPNKTPPEGGALDLPQETEFTGFLSEAARNRPEFLPKTLQVLNKWFPSGYTIQQDKQATSLITAYRVVEGLPENLRGQLAIRLVYPFDPNGDQFFFRIYMIARQTPKKSIDWKSPDAGTQKIFDELVKKDIRRPEKLKEAK